MRRTATKEVDALVTRHQPSSRTRLSPLPPSSSPKGPARESGSASLRASQHPGRRPGCSSPGTGAAIPFRRMLTPGEAVVPKHLVSAVAPFLGANKVPGFAAGGMVAPMLPPVADTTGLAPCSSRSPASLTASRTDHYRGPGRPSSAVTAAQAVLSRRAEQPRRGSENIKRMAKIPLPRRSTRRPRRREGCREAEATAKTHMDAIEKMKKSTSQERTALAAAKNIYDADVNKVAKDKAALTAAAKRVHGQTRSLPPPRPRRERGVQRLRS